MPDPKETPPEPEKIITPDWQKIIDGLTGKLTALVVDREERKKREDGVAEEIKSLKEKLLTAPETIKDKVNEAFAPFDLFF